MGAVSFLCFPQSLCLVPSAFPSARLGLLPIGLLGAELESEGRGAWVSSIVRGLEGLGRRGLKGSSQQVLYMQSGLSPSLLLPCLHFPTGVRAASAYGLPPGARGL